jgi:hypothetical protein
LSNSAPSHNAANRWVAVGVNIRDVPLKIKRDSRKLSVRCRAIGAASHSIQSCSCRDGPILPVAMNNIDERPTSATPTPQEKLAGVRRSNP